MNKYIAILFYLIFFSGCTISFIPKGGLIDEKTMKITQFDNIAALGASNLSVTFTEKAKDYFQQNTKLQLTDNEADIELNCTITSYTVQSQGAQANSQAANLGRLTITVKYEYINNKRPEKNKSSSVSAQRDYSENTDLNSIEAGLVDEISTQIISNIFNATVGDW